MHHMRPRRIGRRARRRATADVFMLIVALLIGIVAGASTHLIDTPYCPPAGTPTAPVHAASADTNLLSTASPRTDPGQHRPRTAVTAAESVLAGTVETADSSLRAGSAIVLNSTGLLMTNHHVIAGTVAIHATLADGRSYSAVIVGSDVVHDIALIQLVDAVELPVVRFSQQVRVGQPVTAIGNAWGAGVRTGRGSVTGLHRNVPFTGPKTATGPYVMHGMVEVDAGIVPGMSGGALANDRGQVVGVIVAYLPGGSAGPSATSPAPTGAGYAIPISTALRSATALMDFSLHHLTPGPRGMSDGFVTVRPAHAGRGLEGRAR